MSNPSDPPRITPAIILYGQPAPEQPWQPLTANGQLNAAFIADIPAWQQYGVSPRDVSSPPRPRLPAPLPLPAPAHANHLAGQYAPPGQQAVPAASAQPHRTPRRRVASSAHHPAPAPATPPVPVPPPAPAPWKPYGTRSTNATHAIASLSLNDARQLLTFTFQRNPQCVQCPVTGCGKTCNTPGEMQQHVYSSHVGEIYACPRCPKVFKTPQSLQKHLCSR
ncbi:hypothetical protein AURDEDRAFT_162189 [Auricularia subglabra TFB-10046 SS5]|nr:hypothetical protein AURDEDRAFT_162189 [Auricularia subglabra TFB-10046 SS5]